MIKAQCLGFLNTPPLWEGKQFDIQQFEFPSIDLSSFQPEPLPQNIRLGHQVEYIFKQLIEHSAQYNILVYNLPIRKEKRTLGEIDFILKVTPPIIEELRAISPFWDGSVARSCTAS